MGAYTWEMDDRNFGGISAIEVSPDGIDFTAITDKAMFLRGKLVRDAKGGVSGVQIIGRVAPLRSQGPAPFGELETDAEGLAIGPSGAAFVSFERIARVLRYDRIDGRAAALPAADDFAGMPLNGALEALAIAKDGTLYTVPERVGGTAFPVYRFLGGAWDQPFSIARKGNFVPVAADFGPDGRFYLLERQFRGVMGFASRVRSFKVTGNGISDERAVLQTAIGQHGNLEGLSVWHDRAGAIRLTMVADDNFNPVQTTQIVDYRLP